MESTAFRLSIKRVQAWLSHRKVKLSLQEIREIYKSIVFDVSFPTLEEEANIREYLLSQHRPQQVEVIQETDTLGETISEELEDVWDLSATTITEEPLLETPLTQATVSSVENNNPVDELDYFHQTMRAIDAKSRDCGIVFSTQQLLDIFTIAEKKDDSVDCVSEAINQYLSEKHIDQVSRYNKIIEESNDITKNFYAEFNQQLAEKLKKFLPASDYFRLFLSSLRRQNTAIRKLEEQTKQNTILIALFFLTFTPVAFGLITVFKYSNVTNTQNAEQPKQQRTNSNDSNESNNATTVEFQPTKRRYF